MSRHKGDVIINPWVSKEYCGDLNPCYATMYIGNGKCVDYRGRIHKWVGLNDKNPEREYKTVGHIDIDLKSMILEILEDGAVNEARADVPSAQPEWIRVEDDLPNPKDLVLVCNKFGGVHYGFYNGYRWYTANNWLTDAWTRMEDVTHWMHPPKPPEDGE